MNGFMPYTVITHAGKAHIDEVLAIAALAVHRGESPSEIQRMNSNEAAEIVTAGKIPPNCWVIDCGLRYNPEHRLFDHHQDRELPSAALMIFTHLFPELEGTDLHSYFKLVSKVDTQGARSLADSADVGESRDYWSFSQQLLVRVFEKDPLSIINLFSRGLSEKIDFEEVKKAAAEWAEFPGRLVEEDIEGIKSLVYTEHPPIEIFDGLHGIDRHIIEECGAAVVYGYDKNDASIRTLYRTDIGHELLDFTRSEAKNTVFSHQGGFLLRFRPTDRNEWRKIVSESIL